MPLIKHNQVVAENGWLRVPDDAALPAQGNVMVSIARLLREDSALSAREGQLGVCIEPDDDISEAAKVVGKVALIAFNFPKFSDGRAYSKARLLRERYGFTGELRAVGEVLADQLQYLQRCGFDSFELSEGKDVNAALRALHDFTENYQATSTDPRPLYRRVPRGERTA